MPTQRYAFVPGAGIASLEAADGERLDTWTFEDPRLRRVEWPAANGTLASDEKVLATGSVVHRFAFDPRAARLRISRVGTSPGEATSAAVDPDWRVAMSDVATLDIEPALARGRLGKTSDLATQTIRFTGPSENRLDIVFLGDGYRQTELDKYHADVNAAVAKMLDIEPYRSFAEMINVHLVDVIFIFVIANTSQYGGGGGWVQTGGPRVEIDDSHSTMPTFTAAVAPATMTFDLVVKSGDFVSLPDLVTVTVFALPVISKVAAKGAKRLVVAGTGFAEGAAIEVDGVAVSDTIAAGGVTARKLTSKAALGLIAPGQAATIRVRNPDGAESAAFTFTR